MVDATREHLADDALLVAEHLVVDYPSGDGDRVQAVSDVTFDVRRGETLGLVGESGCGKSSTGRAILQLPPPASGRVTLDGMELTGLTGAALRRVRPQFQMVFQDPVSSLNPRHSAFDIVRTGLAAGGRPAGRERVDEMLHAVGLDPESVGPCRPHQLSGGQCQRVSIARALAVEPLLLVCDEPVAALDVSVQAQILNLLRKMKVTFGLSLLFIAHDLTVVRNVSDRVVVMYLGKLCEIGQPDELFEQPAHPYTAMLIASIPESRDQQVEVRGEPPSPMNPPSGCRFRTRCPRAAEVCAEVEPPLRAIEPGRFAACHFPLVQVDAAPHPEKGKLR